jgi:hypothetical protein
MGNSLMEDIGQELSWEEHAILAVMAGSKVIEEQGIPGPIAIIHTMLALALYHPEWTSFWTKKVNPLIENPVMERLSGGVTELVPIEDVSRERDRTN